MTTALPPCPLCGSDAKGNASATSVWCDSDYCEMRLSKDNWLAICSRVTPAGHVAVPESEIEALRAWLAKERAERPDDRVTGGTAMLRFSIDAIIARLPRKVDHVAQLEKIRAGFVMTAQMDPDGSQASVAAIEAAIVRMREGAP